MKFNYIGLGDLPSSKAGLHLVDFCLINNNCGYDGITNYINILLSCIHPSRREILTSRDTKCVWGGVRACERASVRACERASVRWGVVRTCSCVPAHIRV